MALTKQHKNPFARRIQIVFTGLVVGSVVAVLYSPLTGLFVYAGLVAFLDVFVTLFLKNSYIDSLNSQYVKNLLKITLIELKRYTVFTAFKRLVGLVIITGSLMVSSNVLLSNTLLIGYLGFSFFPILFTKYFKIKLPTIIEYDPNVKMKLDTSSTDVGSPNWWLNIYK
tara:strand:+ start:587 stop:1093 length:507 start_codon:yes stop_codon:yes gene_type:complete